MDYSEEKLEHIMNGSYFRRITAEAEENDDVFSADGAAVAKPDPEMVTLRREQQKHRDAVEKPAVCARQWSTAHRCFDCAWSTMRQGRPVHHPPKPTLAPFGSGCDDSPTLVTLQSLGQTRDSGYEPSPTSASSFSFSSDDETEHEPPEEAAKTGASPPIDIPDGGRRKMAASAAPALNRRHYMASAQTPELVVPVAVDVEREAVPPQPSAAANAEQLLRTLVGERYSIRDKIIWSPRVDKGHHLRRTKSVPDLSTLPPIPRTPNVQRGSGGGGESLQQTPSPAVGMTPCHGRNYSCPATTSDGRVLLSAPTSATPASRASREGLIDLAEEDPDGAYGHKRRVLVLALPDLVKDAGGQPGYAAIRDPVPPSRGSSSSSISGGNLSSNSSGVECDTFGRAFGQHSPLRPAWRRPRALSCDVTMEVEVGKDLRRIADDFNRTASSSMSLWSTFANAVRRRMSIASTISEDFQTPPETPPESPTEYAQFHFSMDEEFL